MLYIQIERYSGGEAYQGHGHDVLFRKVKALLNRTKGLLYDYLYVYLYPYLLYIQIERYPEGKTDPRHRDTVV